jgi:hypothetical protein
MGELEKTIPYQDMARKKARGRQVALLANTLACQLQIEPHATGLIWCLGSGDERSNLEALRTWIDGLLGEDADQAVADQLLSRLESHLARHSLPREAL